MAKTAEQMVSSGVKELIKKLENDGVAKGRDKATQIIAEAEKKAKELIETAKAEAEKVRKKAQTDAQKFATAGEEELKMASRDAMLALRKDVEHMFAKRIGNMLDDALSDKKILENVILEIAGNARKKAKVSTAKDVEFILPEKVVSLDELRKNAKKTKVDGLTKLVMGVGKTMLQDGVSFSVSNKIDAGVKVVIKDSNVEVDLTEKAVAEILLSHLQPRFRAVLEGVHE